MREKCAKCGGMDLMKSKIKLEHALMGMAFAYAIGRFGLDTVAEAIIELQNESKKNQRQNRRRATKKAQSRPRSRRKQSN